MKTGKNKLASSFNISVWIPYMILVLVLFFMNIYQPGLVTFRWINRQMDTWVTLAFVAIGQTLVFMIGGTDLSVGGIICFTNCLAAVAMPKDPLGVAAFCIAILAIGAAAGLINGVVIVKLHLQPFIATLATWAVWYGAAMCLLSTDGGSVSEVFSSVLIHSFTGLGGLRVSFLLLLALVIIGVFFKASSLGIALRAVGSNEKGAFFGGIQVDKTKTLVYMISGLCAAMAGLFRTAQVSSGSPTAGNDFILLSCASAVIGGCSATTGYFSFAGAIVGAAIMRLLTSLMVTIGVSSYMTSVFQGLILIVAVCINSITAIMRETKRMEVDAK